MSDLSSQHQPDEALVDLLVKHVTEGLSPAEQRALDALDTEVASAYSRDFERAAAAVALAASTAAEPLPAALAQRLESVGLQHVAPAGVADIASARAVRSRPSRPSAAYGWLAAAASLLIALFAWFRPPALAPVAQVPPAVAPAPVPAPPAPPTLAEEREALLAKNGALKITLGATKDPAAAGVTGDVVWDPATQRGYLHFAGLAPNDPAMRQYQLWIFDGARDKRYPVDGGVFDIPANATDVVIPIHAALAVLKPAAFAVTIEKPGGVVVSGREHVVVLGTAS